MASAAGEAAPTMRRERSTRCPPYPRGPIDRASREDASRCGETVHGVYLSGRADESQAVELRAEGVGVGDAGGVR